MAGRGSALPAVSTAAPPSAVVGLASRKAATAALEAHVAVLKGTPLRKAISEALAEGGNLGGKERRFVAFAARELSRHLRRLDLSAKARGYTAARLHLPEDQALLRYALWRKELTFAVADRVMVELKLPGPIRPRSLPDAVLEEELARDVTLDFGATPLDQAANRHSFPTWLAEAIAAVAPPNELEAVLAALNREPTLTFRVRPPGTRDELLAALRAKDFEVKACEEDPDALRATTESRAIFESRWMKEGRLQVMDLGSQKLAAFCRAQAGMTVVDYCAGAGGKTLVLADAVGPRGRVYAWDSNAGRLKEARRRVGEAKLTWVSFPKEPRLDLAELVLVDAPCSGSGTLGREPDQKWKLTAKKVAELAKTQGEILATIAPKLKAGAVLVYGTCSVLREEDEAVVERFLASHADFRLDESLRVWPHQLEGGGFFGARLLKA
ncbi:MAG: RsmB/NOP family class I SAM-dependent RNA methyltransferase [Myxococcales bacterium]|nr:RsmB/NOP family class I SAM-dependent RNA methyltransferase [Myxococcales bacterium]